MTMNIAPYFGVESGNPLNYYKPNQIPFEALTTTKVTRYGVQPVVSFDKLVGKIVKHRERHNLSKLSPEEIKEKLLAHTRKHGLDDAAGRGFWSDVASSLKGLGTSVLHGVQSAVENPMGTLSSVAGLAPLLL